MKQTEPRVAIVTGGASGIGAAIAHELDANGYQVHIWDLASPAEERFVFHCVDVSDDAAVSDAASHYKRVHLLVNAAGISGGRRSIHLTPSDEWRQVLAVDLNGPFYCSVALYEAIRAAAGVVVNIASNAALLMQNGRAHYSVAKAGLVTLTRSLAYEWAPHGVRVIAISPGYTRTPMVQRGLDSGQMDLARIASVSRMGRLVEPQEVAAVVVSVASPAFSYVTGENIVVDGGATLGHVRVDNQDGTGR